MHDNNKKWLDDLKREYPNYFNPDSSILEVGSKDWNGSVRPWFEGSYYHGIDIDHGVGVDSIVAAKDFVGDREFDVIVSFSVLEHDFEWRKSLTNILKYLKLNGMLFMCWGAEGNIKHNEPWASVPHNEVIGYLSGLEFKIIDNFFEEDRYGKNCAGCYNLIAKK